MATMKETTSNTWTKLAEIETTDFSHENIFNLICETFGEEIFELGEIANAIKSRFIEICEDGFIVWAD